MKKSIHMIPLILALTATNCGSGPGSGTGGSAKNTDEKGSGEIVFNSYEHDFGKVTEGEKVAYIFTFVNKGTSDLILKSVSTSCGCTVPKYDTKPIAPGGEGNLEVIFDTTGRNGRQTKTITVKSNASSPVVLLRITAEVEDNLNY